MGLTTFLGIFPNSSWSNESFLGGCNHITTTLLNDVDPHNITIGWWEFSFESPHVAFRTSHCLLWGPRNESYNLDNVRRSQGFCSIIKYGDICISKKYLFSAQATNLRWSQQMCRSVVFTICRPLLYGLLSPAAPFFKLWYFAQQHPPPTPIVRGSYSPLIRPTQSPLALNERNASNG